MTNLLDRLRSRVIPRDPEPLQSLLYAWASKRGKAERLPFSQEKLLESVNEHPCLNRQERTERLSWSIKKFQNAKDALEGLAMVETQTLSSGPGRPDTYLLLTDVGFRYLRRHRIPPNRLHGSLKHHCAMLRLRSLFEQRGYTVELTQQIDHAVVDLFCKKRNERLAIEVVASDNLARDAKKCEQLTERLDHIHLVTTGRDLFNEYVSRIGKLLSPAARAKVQVSRLSEFLSAAESDDKADPASPSSNRS